MFFPSKFQIQSVSVHCLIIYVEKTIFLSKDERLSSSTVKNTQQVENSSTIAAIVTSLGGPPSAVGIVRLSGPSAISIASRVFRPARRKKGKASSSSLWQPTSHLVEYGVVLDHHGNVIDEVMFHPAYPLSLLTSINRRFLISKIHLLYGSA